VALHRTRSFAVAVVALNLAACGADLPTEPLGPDTTASALCTGTALAVTRGATAFQLTATTGCTGTPEYRFFALAPGASRYTALTGYTTSSTVAWDAATAAPGRWTFLVYVREAGTPVSYDSYASSSQLLGTVCTAATVSAAAGAGTLVDLAATASCGGLEPEYRFLVRPSGTTAFTEVRPFGTSPKASWDTASLKAGRYDVVVYARAAGNLSTYEAAGSSAHNVGAVCSAATLGAAPGDGTSVNLTATATCPAGLTPEYQFFARAPGATAYTELGRYGSAPTFRWETAGLASGRWDLRVFVRAAGHTSTYESYAATGQNVGSVCTAATVTATAGAGSLVNLSATATCPAGLTPEYRFLARAPNAPAFIEVRGYGTNPAATWDTASLAGGQYLVVVYVRTAENGSAYEAYASMTRLVGNTCAQATLAATAGAGEAVSLAATSTCSAGATPEYRFFVTPPGAYTYTYLTEYGPAATFDWSSTGLTPGRYLLGVFTRAKGNLSVYEGQATLARAVGDVCTAAKLTAAQGPGTTVSLSASATCAGGAAADYQFLVKAPGATAATAVRGYAADPTSSWDYSQVPGGKYTLIVYARLPGNGSTYEAAASATFDVPACQSTCSPTAPVCAAGAIYACELRPNGCYARGSWATSYCGSGVCGDASRCAIPPSLWTFDASPRSIRIATPASVTWQWAYLPEAFQPAAYPEPVCSIDQGVGTVVNGASSQITLADRGTKTFTLTCSNTGGSATKEIGLTALEPVKQVDSGGWSDACAVTKAGEVRCFTSNAAETLPWAVTGFGAPVTAVSVGWDHSCAVTGDGRVLCWGKNTYGQLGDGTLVDSDAPVAVVGLPDAAVAVSAGDHFTCALVLGGEVSCWGYGRQGQLGNGAMADSPVPVPARDGAAYAEISAGGSFACGLTTNGVVRCWGNNANGQLGDGTTTSRGTSLPVIGLTSVATAIASGAGHACAIVDGTVRCWGANNYGQLGTGSASPSFMPFPNPVPWVSGATTLAVGTWHACSAGTNGVQCWGMAGDHIGIRYTGDGTPTPITAQPVPIAEVISLSVGRQHSCAVSRTEGVKCWGDIAYSSYYYDPIVQPVAGLTGP
jgi:hypothetical protein